LQDFRISSPASASKTDVPQRRSAALTFVFFLALLGTVSRGLFELAVGKTGAYGLQLALVSLFILLLLASAGPRIRPRAMPSILALYAFVIAGVLSVIASLNLNGIDYAGPYVLVSVFYAGVLAIFTSVRFERADKVAFGPVIVVVATLLALVGLAQQFAGLTFLPGNDRGTFGDFSRPASLTGSFLHYPLAAALLGFALLGMGSQMRKRAYSLVGIFVLVAVVASLSRSGLVMLFVGLAFGILKLPQLGTRLRALGFLAAMGTAAVFIVPSDRLTGRVLSIFQFEGTGNANRVQAWSNVLDLWFDSPILIGSHAGQFTNVTSNLAGTNSSVAESGVLQILVSFGVLGLLAFYGLMFSVIREVPKLPPWFMAGAVASIAQSAVYQSIEVFPFMVIYAMYPLFATASDLSADASPRDS